MTDIPRRRGGSIFLKIYAGIFLLLLVGAGIDLGLLGNYGTMHNYAWAVAFIVLVLGLFPVYLVLANKPDLRVKDLRENMRRGAHRPWTARIIFLGVLGVTVAMLGTAFYLYGLPAIHGIIDQFNR